MRSLVLVSFFVLFFSNKAISKSLLEGNVEYLNTFTLATKKIALYGDKNHFDKSNHDSFSRLIAELNKNDPDYNCIFLEFDSRFQNYFDKYVGSSSFTVENIFDKALADYPIDRMILSSKEASLYFRDVFVIAKSLNLKIIAADVDFSTAVGLEMLEALDAHLLDPTNEENLRRFSALLIENRNRTLSEKVTKYFESNSCSKVIVYFGDGHFQNFYRNHPIRSVQYFLTLQH